MLSCLEAYVVMFIFKLSIIAINYCDVMKMRFSEVTIGVRGPW